MEFKKATKDDYSTVCSYLKNSKVPICDFTPGAFIMWHKFYDVEFSLCDDFLYLRDGGSIPSYFIPVGEGDFEKAVKKLTPFAKGGKLNFNCVTVDKLILLRQIFGRKYTKYKFNRDAADYIYTADSMVTFAGKKLSAMRNHVNRFKKDYPDYRFIKMSESNFDRVRDYLRDFALTKGEQDSEAKAEYDGIYNLIDNIDYTDWCGGFIELDGKIIAISIGEYIGDTLVIHVEKADVSYSGCYQIMVNEFAKAFVREGIKYINREDDIGLEGLRKSKLAYRPIKLIDKADVEISICV
ncbi:MAG: phosphatidylglycerol lysyltransferase domain-containing protein [Acutalibacteraceae bacterium]|nr:phosphatidylglycerol lysyltransferase domain-containing protein [Acutalibacteraceae bacterium]